MGRGRNRTQRRQRQLAVAQTQAALAQQQAALAQQQMAMGMPAPIPQAVAIVQQQHASAFVGPLPHPDDLIRYGQAGSDAVNRIITMAEKEQASRLAGDYALQQVLVQDQMQNSKTVARGQVLAALVFISALGCATVLAMNDHAIISGILATLDIVGVVGLFLNSRERGARPPKQLQQPPPPGGTDAPPQLPPQ